MCLVFEKFVSVGPVGIDFLEFLQEGRSFSLAFVAKLVFVFVFVACSSCSQYLQYLDQSENDPLAVGRILEELPKEIRLLVKAFYESVH